MYYSSQIFFFGAEFTHIYAREFGSDPLNHRHSSTIGTHRLPKNRVEASELPPRAVSGDVEVETKERGSGIAGGLIGSALAATRVFRAFRR